MDVLTFLDDLDCVGCVQKTTEVGFLEEAVDFRGGEIEGVWSELHATNLYSDEPWALAPAVEEVELDMKMKIK